MGAGPVAGLAVRITPAPTARGGETSVGRKGRNALRRGRRGAARLGRGVEVFRRPGASARTSYAGQRGRASGVLRLASDSGKRRARPAHSAAGAGGRGRPPDDPPSPSEGVLRSRVTARSGQKAP